jgi:CheY-like chemotaxis protein
MVWKYSVFTYRAYSLQKGSAVNTPPKILIIDDNHDELDIIEMFLYKDFEIISAVNGFDGIKRAEEEVPDLIITDIVMPVMDGIRFFNTLKKQKNIDTIPVLALTAFNKNDTRSSQISIGFSGVLPKPLDRTLTIQTIRELLNLKPEIVDSSQHATD